MRTNSALLCSPASGFSKVNFYIITVTSEHGVKGLLLHCGLLFVFSAPAAPRNVRVTEVEATRLLVNWSAPFPPSGVVTAYRIIYKVAVNGQVTQTLQLTGSGSNSRWISELLPFTQYEIQVRELFFKQIKSCFTRRSPNAVPEEASTNSSLFFCRFKPKQQALVDRRSGARCPSL